MRVRALPYLQADTSSVTVGDWHRHVHGTDQRVGECLFDWDSLLDVAIVRDVSVDAVAVRSCCGLDEGTELRLVASWWSDQTWVAESAPPVRLVDDRPDVRLSLQVPAPRAGGVLHVLTRLCLGVQLEPRPLRASRPGTVLWEEEQTVRLEGTGPRVPCDSVPFSQARGDLHAGAAWHIELNGADLEASARHSVRVLLNTENAATARLLADPRSETGVAMQESIRFALARALLNAALDDDAFVAGETTWPSNSIGRVVARLFRTNFRDTEHVRLRQLRDSDREAWETLLQDRLRFMESVS